MSGREGWSNHVRLQELAGARERAWQLPHPQLDLRDKWDPQRLGSCQKSSWTTTPREFTLGRGTQLSAEGHANRAPGNQGGEKPRCHKGKTEDGKGRA